MLTSTSGFLLSKIKYGDSSLILKIFCEELGLISVMKKGAFSAKAKKKLLFYPLAEIDFSFYRKEDQQLHLIRDWDYKNIPKLGIEKNSILLFLAEFVQSILAESDKNHEVYAFVKEKLIELEKAAWIGGFALQFMAQITKFLGFYPNFHPKDKYFDLLKGTYQSQSSNFTLEISLNCYWEMIFSNQQMKNIPISQRRILMDELLRYFELHMEGFRKPKSLEIFKEVFAN